MAAVETEQEGNVDLPASTKNRAKARVAAGTTTVRVSVETHENLRWLAEELGAPLQQALDKAVEQYRRQVFLEKANEEYARLRADPEAWAEELAERELWERAGLEDLQQRLADEPPYPLTDEDRRAIEEWRKRLAEAQR